MVKNFVPFVTNAFDGRFSVGASETRPERENVMIRKMSLLCAIAALAACADKEPVNPPADDANATARLRVVQGTSTTVDVIVDGRVVLSGVARGQASNHASLTAGEHLIGIRRAGSTMVAGTRSITLGAQDTANLVLIDSSTVINPVVLTDTGATPAAGKTKLRVVHFATNAPPIDVWRTQPDWGTLIRVMFPFDYRAASSYLQSDPGNWNVVVTPKDQTTQLYSTGDINVPAGEVRTVVLLDAPGGGITSVTLNQ